MRFPTINGLEQFKEHGWKECYVFQDPADPECPIVLHFILNNISYRDYVEPGGYFKRPVCTSDFSCDFANKTCPSLPRTVV